MSWTLPPCPTFTSRATMGPLARDPCPSSTVSPFVPLMVLRSPPTSILFCAMIRSASMEPPTSRESSLSSAPMYALPPMSRSFSSVRLPDTRKSPPTSTSTPFPFPFIDAMPPTSRELNERSALLSNFPPTSTSPPSPPSTSVARPPTSIFENFSGFVDSNLPPTSTSLETSPPPIRAMPPTSSFANLTMLAMSTVPPTSTSSTSAVPWTLNEPPTSTFFPEMVPLTSRTPPTSKSSARAFPPILKALSTVTVAASRDPSIASCPSSTFTSLLAIRSPSILIFPWRAENSEHDRLPWNSASPSQDTLPATWITLSSGSILAASPTLRLPSTLPSFAVAPLSTETSPIFWKPYRVASLRLFIVNHVLTVDCSILSWSILM